MKKVIINSCLIILSTLMLSVFHSCYDDGITENTSVTHEDMAGEFVSKNPNLSEFYKMAEKADMLGILNSYGKYTCFIPNNYAVNKFIQESQYGNLDEFPADSLRKIVLYHLVENDKILSSNFTVGYLRSSNMGGDNLQIDYYTNDNLDVIIRVNRIADISLRDQEVKNGVIHVINSVLKPSPVNVATKLLEESLNGRYSIFAQALEATGVSQLLSPIEDNTTFIWTNKTTGAVTVVPRKFKFTLLVESNDLFKQNGIEDFEALKKHYDDGKGTGITDPANGLYRFVAYHCLDRVYDTNDFNTHSAWDGYEIVPTMCPNTLIEYRKWADPIGGRFNRFTDYAGNVLKDGVEISSETNKRNIMANNGMVHELKQILEIPDQNLYFLKKMRFNIAVLSPELQNNGFRNKLTMKLDNPGMNGPQYYKNIKVKGETGDVELWFDYTNIWVRHQWDELMIGNRDDWSNVRSDVEITTPPIPKGTWEIRLGYTHNQFKGMFQIYWDGKPVGVPVNMYRDQDYGISGMDEESAKKTLRYNDMMIFPPTIQDAKGNFVPIQDPGGFRRIVTVENFSEMKQHKLRFKNVSAGLLSLNFFEIIPYSQIEDEVDN